MSTEERTNNSKPVGAPTLTSNWPTAVPPIMITMYEERMRPLFSLVARSFSQLSRTTHTPALQIPLMK